MNEYLKKNKQHLLIWTILFSSMVIAITYGVDKKFVVFITLFLGLFTQIFSGFGALVTTIPLVGPIIIKVFTIPFFWVLNALGYFVSVIAIKKGYKKEVASSRVLTIALLLGIIVGYILGHIVPLK
tara:strand:- start:13 stop:390 length:378 start_codon:yes stop_codon:yes gene_type:complete